MGRQAEEIGDLRAARPGIAQRPGVGQPPGVQDAAAAVQTDPAVMAAWAASAAADDPTTFLQALGTSINDQVKKAVDETARSYMTRAREQQGFVGQFFQENPGLATGEGREMFEGSLYRIAGQNQNLSQDQLYQAAKKATLGLMDRMGYEQVADDPQAAAAAAEAARVRGLEPRGSRPPATPAPPNSTDLLAGFTREVGDMAKKRMSRTADPRLPE